MCVGAEVGRDDLFINILQNALHGAFGSGLDGGADLVVACALLQADGQVNDGHVACGNTHGGAGQLALQLGDNLADSLGSAGAGGDDVVVNAAAQAPVLLGEAVNYGLGGGGGVNGGHETLNDTEVVVDDLGQRSKAVGGAGSVGNELHVGGVLVQVYAADEHGGVVLCGAGHDDDLCAGVDMGLSVSLGEELAGALENVLGAQLAPGKQRRIAGVQNGEALAVDDEELLLVVEAYVCVESAVNGVVLDSVGQLTGGLAGSVDADDFDIIGLDSSSESQTADAAKTIDANFDHYNILQKIILRNSVFALTGEGNHPANNALLIA